jgi:hypothetical protein
MKHSFGTNTIYEKYRCRYFKENEKILLVSDGIQPPGFIRQENEIYIKQVKYDEVNCAFYFRWKCRIENNILSVLKFTGSDTLIGDTIDKGIAEKLHMQPGYDRGDYQKQFHFSELDAIWEERSESPDGLPFPEGLARIEYLKGGPGDL